MSGQGSGASSRCASIPICLTSANRPYSKSPAQLLACRRDHSTTRPRLCAPVSLSVMMFVQSLGGISHNKVEDSKEEHIATGCRCPGSACDQDCGLDSAPRALKRPKLGYER